MSVKDQIKQKILSNQKDMRLDIFLDNAMFAKNSYYYDKKPIGKKKDFITSPEISQMFGEIIGLYLFYFWNTKINAKFNFIELGPGNGTLFKDIFDSVSNFSNFLKEAKVIFIEINSQLKKMQKEICKKLNLKNIKWHDNINIKSNLPSIIYSNEFFDCFPVRQFIYTNRWFEKYVRFNHNNDSFFFVNKVIYNKNLVSYLNQYKKQKFLEVSFARNNYYEKICKFIKKNGGIFLTVDYGYLKNKDNFTLQAIQNHKYSHVLENVGEKDISSHVNFLDLINIAKKNELKIEEFCSQAEFLKKYGILERKKYLSKFGNTKEIESQLHKLMGENEMGKLFKFLIVSSL